MKKLRTLSFVLLLVCISTLLHAQRTTDKLDRGLVAVPASSGGCFISWRIFAEEYYDTEYNLYRDGEKLNDTPLKVSNYTDLSGNANSKYQVAPVVRGVEQQKSKEVTRWSQQFLEIPVANPTDRNGNDASSYYSLNDVSLADLDGDGVSEFIVKRPGDAWNVDQKLRFHQLDCYDHKGNRLWWIDLGPNMLAGADEQWDAVAYDWDGDGKAEVLLRGQDNMIIHHGDGTTTNIGDMTVDTRWSGIEYTSSGNEYLLYLEGGTGKPYQIGPSAHPNYMVYPLTRGADGDWGAGIVGHRSTKHFFGAPFLDGRKASIFLGRGIYTKEKMVAFDVDPITHALTQRWYWECNVGGPWFGQGYHNYAIGDVDWDGRDEIIYGSMVIDDNGKGLSTTGLGHGDAQHCADLDPYRHGAEQFACNENAPAMNYRNATTSQMYYRHVTGGDDGRALCANFTNSYPGSVGRSVSTGWVSTTADKIIDALGGDAFISWGDLNQRIYWDGDLCDEYMESPGTEGYAVVYKPATGARILSATDTKLSNSSKNNPGAIGDLWGDWREELVLRRSDNKALRVYTTNIPTNFGIYTLWHDHQYRNAMVWQSLGYNQPPHKSYFLGEMEGITVAPPPYTMTGRTEVKNGGTITNEDKHFIVCETNDTEVTIADGASPYIVTFNVPSWVQGTAGNNVSYADTEILRTYYTCNVKGGGLSGQTKLIKQGDGVLTLPKADMKHKGETNVWAGTLNFDGSMLKSPLWLNRFAELNSNGGHFMNIKAEYGSVIRPGGKNLIGELIVDSTLNMSFGSCMEIDVDGTQGKSDVFKTKKLSLERKGGIWLTYGPKYLQPIIRINSNNLSAGEYVIAEVEEIKGSLANILIEGTGDFKYGLTHVDGKVILTLGNTRGASHIVWKGSVSGEWDFAKTENFILANSQEALPEIFVKGDIVEFNDEASRFAVTVNEALEVDSLVVDGTKTYSFSGTGAIANGAFSKRGTGTVSITLDNTYTGGNCLSGGVVKVTTLSNNVQAHGNLGGVTNSASKFIMTNGAELQTLKAVTNGSQIRFDGAEGGVINNQADFTQQALFSGTVLTKRGSGWLKTSASGSALSRMIIEAGTVQNGSGNAAKVVEIRNGSLVDNVSTYNEINIPEGGVASWTTGNRCTYTNKLTGTGSITVYCATEKGNGWYATRTPIQLNLLDFAGTFIPQATYAESSVFTFDTSNGMPKGTMNIPETITVLNHGKTFEIGRLDGKGKLGGFCSFNNNGETGSNTWVVGNDEDWSWFGVVTGSGTAFTKVGEGKMTVRGKWDNNGAVRVNEGELCVNNGTLGTGSLVVAKGATLSGRTGDDLTNSAYTINGTCHVGATKTATSGSIEFGNKNVTFATSSVLRLGIAKAATKSNTGGGSLKNINRMNMNGVISLYYDDDLALEVGDSVVLWTASNSRGNPVLESNVIDEEKKLYWDTKNIVNGVLYVTDKNPSGIDDISVDATVQVNVVASNGVSVNSYTCELRDVETVFNSMDLPKGVYMLNIAKDKKHKVIKVRKN